MTSPRSKSQPYQPPAEFGQRAVELAKSVGKTREDILKATDKTPKTLKRLESGDGSLLFAYAVKQVLKDWGADVSKLPPLDEDGAEPVDERLREGLELLKRLWQLATDKYFDEMIAGLRDDVRVFERAHDLIASGSTEIRRRR